MKKPSIPHRPREVENIECPACGSLVSPNSIIDINGSIACIKCLK